MIYKTIKIKYLLKLSLKDTKEQLNFSKMSQKSNEIQKMFYVNVDGMVI